MKIRTDFVTNSSSYSSAEVVIDNPVLGEILIRYKEMGTKISVRDEEYFRIGDPAIFYVVLADGATYYSGCPTMLEEVVDHILKVLNDLAADFEVVDDLFNQMVAEIETRRDEINQEYISVDWHSRMGYDDADQFDDWHFQFDQQNGETYKFEEIGPDDDSYYQ